MMVGIWIYHALTFLPIFGLIFFNSEIAEFVHSQFELGATLLGDVANYSGFLAALLWFLINDRLDLSEKAYVFILSRQDPLEYAEGAEGYLGAGWERFAGAPATQFAMLELPGETNKSEEFSNPRCGALLAVLDTFFICVPENQKFSLEIDYAIENTSVYVTLSEGERGVKLSFSELEEPESLFPSLSKPSTEEELSRYLKMSLAAAADPSAGVGPDDVFINEITDQSISGIRGISYDARIIKPDDQTVFYQMRCLQLAADGNHYEIKFFDDAACSEDLLVFSSALLRAVAVRQGVFLGQYAAFR